MARMRGGTMSENELEAAAAIANGGVSGAVSPPVASVESVDVHSAGAHRRATVTTLAVGGV